MIKKHAIDTNILIGYFLSEYEKTSLNKNADAYIQNKNKKLMIPGIVISEFYTFIFNKTYKKYAQKLKLGKIAKKEAEKIYKIRVYVSGLFLPILTQIKSDGYILDFDGDAFIEDVTTFGISPNDFLLGSQYKIITGDRDFEKYQKQLSKPKN